MKVYLILIAFAVGANACRPTFAPYFDITLTYKRPIEVYKETGQKSFTLAFVLGGNQGCVPMWGGVTPLDDPEIISKIREIQGIGGEIIVATGGAAGPYLETSCASTESLADAYEKILSVTKSTHLDVDIEASVDMDRVTKALALVQRKNEKITVSFTLMVQGDDYGITPTLGVELLKTAVRNGLRVDIVNPMTMEFGSSKPSWGDAVISAAEATVRQMKEIWPMKSQSQLYRMLGVTPMIGRNFNGKIFEVAHAKQLLDWAIKNQIGFIGFWSVARDNGKCAGGGVSPTCSSIAQSDFEFTKLLMKYANCLEDLNNTIPDPKPDKPNEPTQMPTTTSGRGCRGLLSSFDDWCKANCAVGFCPPEYCTCN